MNTNIDELFELKKAVLQYGFDSKHYSGAYYPGLHGIEVNINYATYPQALISYIHESTHAIVHEKKLGNFQLDYLILFLELVYFSNEYKSILIDDYLTSKKIYDIEEKSKYVFVNSLEIDEFLATDQKYVDYLKFCISMYDIYLFSVVSSSILNESFATFISLNVDSKCFMYKVLNLKKFFYNNSIKIEIKKQQEAERHKIKTASEENMYSLANTNILKSL